MPKRKRAEDDLEEKLARHRLELFRKLKLAKGFERQRMAKRQRDPKSTLEKRARIEKEIVVLKVQYPRYRIRWRQSTDRTALYSPSTSNLSQTPTCVLLC